ncbi:hypothetical protein ACHWQZ_G005506 [Mnemiopsis leidyi]
MYLWIVIFMLDMSTRAANFPRAAITKFSSNVTLSDEVCGYLRHLETGTCVGKDSYTGSLVASTTSCSDQDHIFCHSTKDKTMVQVTRNGSEEMKCKGRVSLLPGNNDTLLKLRPCSGNNTDINNKWRSKINGRIRQEAHRTRCWARNHEHNIITLEDCDRTQTEDSAKPQQFGIQLKGDMEKEPYHLFSKDRDYLKVFIHEIKRTISDKDYRFEINVDFFSKDHETSLGFLKLQGWQNSEEKYLFNLIYKNWNEMSRCMVGQQEIESSAEHNVNLLMWISKTGNLNVIVDGKKMTIICENDIWSEVNRLKVIMFDMKKGKNRNAEKLFEMHYEIIQVISKFCWWVALNFYIV